MTSLLRSIPKVTDFFTQEPICLLQETYPAAAVTEWIRAVLAKLREDILCGSVQELPPLSELSRQVTQLARRESQPSLRPVINGTGVVLHTNLGRSCLSEKAAAAVYETARSYSTLEYNLASGQRGSRHDHAEALLRQLTGAEAAMVVNNNAAAVMLILTALGSGGEVIASRGELVEIGGSFRIPDVMELCGCRLHEVGATNKTHLYDYENAINEDTRALLKVHTSNYRIMGFTETVPLGELVELGHARHLPVVEDLGSGCLLDLSPCGIMNEPTVQSSVKAGVDVISFSGDKLLGGPQAGIIIGKKVFIDRMKRHQLSRAVRIDKMTLAALVSTLQSYRAGRAAEELPVLSMLSAGGESLQKRAETLCQMLRQAGLDAAVTAQKSPVGGGAVPTQELPGYAVSISPGHLTVNGLEAALRMGDIPIIGRISAGRYLLYVRT
ncbi:MAG: L-seryl-tRNA(Sec) selenium transferase, partial [Clostridiales bacterium]|nr:L-seryl-tRNA(Sec) selenium transferase [Clostridiales bacterium]